MKQRFLLIMVLSFISIYLGTSHGDPSLSDGKNLANFSLLYVLGNTLHAYKGKWEVWSNKILISIYILSNLLLVLLFCTFDSTIIPNIIWRISFPYCSPILILNAMLFFIIIAKYQLKSKWINYAASSMFAVYLIHCQPFIEKNIIGSAMHYIMEMTGSVFSISLITVLIGVFILTICVITDKCFTPLFALIYKRCDALLLKHKHISFK